MKFAGILPYFLDMGKIYYILGNEKDGSGWNPFGGSPESSNLRFEAAREFEEETMGFFGNKDVIYNLLEFCPYYFNDKIILYLLKLDLTKSQAEVLCDSFKNVYSHFNFCDCPNGYLEMDKIDIFTFDDLIASKNILRKEFQEIL